MATRPGRAEAEAEAEAGKQNDGAETRRVPSAHATTRLIASFRCSAAARAPPSSLLPESPGALATPTAAGGGRETGSRAPRRSFPSHPLPEGDPAEDRRQSGRGMGGRDD